MNIKINNRLQKISDFINYKDKAIDVGCDHSLLGIYLVINKNIKKIVSSDINEKPLNKAKENIKKYHLESIIETRLGNGLSCVTPDLDTVIISGMGGLTIISILKDIKKYPNINKLIISPNSDFSKTRKFIIKKGFKIEKEQMICENNKYYLVSCYEKGKEKKIDYNFGKLESNQDNINYYKYCLNKNNEINKHLSLKHFKKKLSLIIINKKLNKRIK